MRNNVKQILYTMENIVHSFSLRRKPWLFIYKRFYGFGGVDFCSLRFIFYNESTFAYFAYF
jgi:hypothetical protein